MSSAIHKSSRLAALWVLPCLSVLASPVLALEVPPLTGRVVDRGDILDAASERVLSQKLAAYEQQTGHQFALLTVESLEGDSIEDFALRVVESWKLGHKNHDNGLLLLVALKDRKVRIEVGYGLEGVIPDAIASRVIRDVITPAFRQGDYAGGLSSALTVLMQAGSGEAVELPQNERSPSSERLRIPWWLLLVFFLLAPPSLRWFGLGMLLGGGGRHRGGFGDGGFGGGFSGGGGRFGGGGASGGW